MRWIGRTLAAAMIGCGLNGTAYALTEESIPAGDLTATAAPSPAPGASASATATPTAVPTPITLPRPLVRPSPIAPPAASEPPGSAATVATDIPAALDVGAVTPEGEISDASLAPLIAAAAPARGAAMRLTENARKEILAKQTDEAIRLLTRALSIDPSSPYAYFYLGRAYYQRKNYKQAVGFFQHAEIGFGADPAWRGETLAFEGICYEEFGQSADALATYQRALDASPGNLMARAGVARLGANAENGSAADVGAPPPPASGPAPPPPPEPPAPGPPVEPPAPTD